MFYIVAAAGFHAVESKDRIADTLAREKLDPAAHVVIEGKMFRPTSQLVLVALDKPAAKEPRKPRAVKEPGKEVRLAVEEYFAPGIAATKRTACEAISLPSDLVGGAIDWLTSKGALKLAGKTYSAVPAAVAP